MGAQTDGSARGVDHGAKLPYPATMNEAASAAEHQKPLSARQKERRQRILEATHGLLVREGYEGLSMKAIALEARVAERTLFNIYALAYAISLYSLALLIKEGAPLSIMMPRLAAVVPLGTIVMALTILGEPASWPRIALLCLSCLVIGAASLV